MLRRDRNRQDGHSKALYDLSSIVLNLLRSPSTTPIAFSSDDDNVGDEYDPASSSTRRMRRGSNSNSSTNWVIPGQITPAGFASMLLGVSLSMMVCGSLTFFIGFMLMPWVIGLVMVLYVVGVVSTLSFLGRSIFCYAMGPSTSTDPSKDINSWKLM